MAGVNSCSRSKWKVGHGDSLGGEVVACDFLIEEAEVWGFCEVGANGIVVLKQGAEANGSELKLQHEKKRAEIWGLIYPVISHLLKRTVRS